MKKLFLIFVLMFSTTLMANEFYGLRTSDYNYFISNFGKTEDSVKMQLSFEYQLFYPYPVGLFAAYTEKAIWQLGTVSSSPFKDYNHNPELFYKLESKNNIFKNQNFYLLDYVKISGAHKSNGRDGADSRSINYTYSDIQLSVGDNFNAGFNYQYLYMIKESAKNRDFYDTVGNNTIKLFFKTKYFKYVPFIETYFQCGGNYKNSDIIVLWKEFGLIIKAPEVTQFQPSLYFQLYDGYNEMLIHYNQKVTEYRIGLLFFR